MATTARTPSPARLAAERVDSERIIAVARSGAPVKLRSEVRNGQFGVPAPEGFGKKGLIGYRARSPDMNTIFPLLALLQEGVATPTSSAPAPGTAPQPPSLLIVSLVPLLLVAALFVFMLILPERKKQKQRQQMLDALKKGDRVMTSSGMFGTVVSTADDLVVLQVADNVRLRFSRGAI